MKPTLLRIIKYSFLLGLYLLVSKNLLLAQSNYLEPITVDNASNIARIATIGDNRIDDVTWSPDGKLLATLGPSGLRLYDAENLQATPQLLVDEPDPRCESYQEYRRSIIQFSSDGANIIAASGACIEFWNLETGTLVSRYWSEIGTGNMAYNENQHVLAFGNALPNPYGFLLYDVDIDDPGDTETYMLDNSDDLPSQTVDFGPVSSVSISPDSRYVAFSSAWFIPVNYRYPVQDASEVYLWEIAPPADSSSQILTTEQAYCVLHGHTEQVGRIAFSSSGNLLASASHDRTIRLWNIPECTEYKVLEGHFGPVWDVEFNSDDSQLVSAGLDTFIRTWDLTTGSPLLAIPVLGTSPVAVSFSPDASKIVSVGWDNSIFIFDAETGNLLDSRSANWGMYWGTDFNSDGSQLASASNDNQIVIWKTSASYPYLQEDMSIQGHAGAVYDVAYSPDGQYLVSGSGDHTVRVWNASSGAELAVLNGHKSAVYSVAFSPDGKLIASGSWDSTVRLWDVQSFELIAVLQGTEPIYSVVFSPDGRYLAYGDTHIWDIEAGEELAYLETKHWWSDQYQSDLSHLAFTPDGNLLFNGGNTGRFYTIKLQTLAEPESAWGNGIPAISPDGTLLATGILSLSNLETGEQLFSSEERFITIYNTMHDVAFSPDGTLIVSSDASSTLQLWGIIPSG